MWMLATGPVPDQPCTASKGKEAQPHLHDHERSILETDQEVDMDE
jgi:hypothetical protein